MSKKRMTFDKRNGGKIPEELTRCNFLDEKRLSTPAGPTEAPQRGLPDRP